ncbi:AraC family transcriptional regulator [Nocardioides limicola]|uniref:AraC family transcriptional regulator n=1 Tax=Nocardioides limicola TaxID=2803368 RepID=UPI00193C455E|nr:AraC family transcriptional regulator [Nocardioides sp. DJM-14]
MHARWDVAHPATSAVILTDLALEYGVREGAVLRETGIDAGRLRAPDTEITGRQEIRLWRNISREVGPDSDFGLVAGTRYHLSSYGIWGLMVLSSATVRDAVAAVLRQFHLTYSFAELSLEQHVGSVDLVFDDRGLPPEIRQLHRDRDVAAVATVQHDLLGGPVEAVRFELPGRPPSYRARYREITGNEPTFGADVCRIGLAEQLLDLPLPQAHPTTAALCEQQCAELLQRRLARTGTAGRVRDLLARHHGEIRQEQVAVALNLSVRSLRRRLAEEATSYRELTAEVNGMLAEELLRGGLTVEEVAHRLGYSTASAFTHAFRQWRGMPPARFAREHPHLVRLGS